MEWSEFLDTLEVEDWVLDRYDVQKTDIKCPDCGRPIYMDKRTLLLSSPPKHKYWCVCGWNAFAPLCWEKKLLKRKREIVTNASTTLTRGTAEVVKSGNVNLR